MTKKEALSLRCNGVAGATPEGAVIFTAHSFIPLETEVTPALFKESEPLKDGGWVVSTEIEKNETHRVTKLICQHCLITVEGEL